MGKRAEARPDISSKLLGMVSEVKAMMGKDGKQDPKTSKASPRPQATPVRSSKATALLDGDSQGEGADATAKTQTKPEPQAANASPAAVPMSLQSTPVKSPDLKRLKSNESKRCRPCPPTRVKAALASTAWIPRLHWIWQSTLARCGFQDRGLFMQLIAGWLVLSAL